MSIIKVSDFYYGSVLLMLFSHGINPALIENSDDRQVYDVTTNNNKFRLFVKYRTNNRDRKSEDCNSWSFNIKKDIPEIRSYVDDGHNVILALVCIFDDLGKSELAIIDTEQIKAILNLSKSSFTISRKKGKHHFRIPTGGRQAEALRIKCNRFEELF